MRNLVIICILCFGSLSLFAQEKDNSSVMKARIHDGDTVLVSNIPEVNIYPAYRYKNKWDYWRYRRLVRNVKVAYPYAKIAALQLEDLDKKLASIRSEKKRKAMVKATEEEIRNQFEKDVRNLTISQGRILIKLIDRETGNTTYRALQDVKGNFSAVFWQTIARVFGSNLKSEYDPQGEDQLIEQIILMIDAGQL